MGETMVDAKIVTGLIQGQQMENVFSVVPSVKWTVSCLWENLRELQQE